MEAQRARREERVARGKSERRTSAPTAQRPAAMAKGETPWATLARGELVAKARAAIETRARSVARGAGELG